MLRYTQVGKAASPREPWLSRLLRNRGINTPEEQAAYLNPSAGQLLDPLLFPDMGQAVALIREAVAAGQLICVYGDYDVDGVCATSILLLYLRQLGGNVMFRIPRRDEGYGMNIAAMEELAAQGVGLLVTVDCGITNHAQVKHARALGLRVIVTDHHEPAETLPQADALLNPKVGYPFPHLCGAGVALKVVQALGGIDAALSLMDLAAIATVSDIVMLTQENRAIVRLGLALASRGERPGLRMLMILSQVGEQLTAQDVSFRIGPRINAGGRLEDAAQCVTMLTTLDTAQAEDIARHLHDLNSRRQAEQTAMLQQAMEQVADWEFHRHQVLAVSHEGWNKGIIGLTAGKLCERYHWPTIVLSSDDAGDEGESVGSCRSIQGVNLHAVLTECADRYRKYCGRELFIRFGGHAMAAGLTIRTGLIPELVRLMDQVIGEGSLVPDLGCYIPNESYDCRVRLGDVSLDMLDTLALLEPTGYGNPPPVFLCQAQVETLRRCGRDGDTLQMSLLDGTDIRRAVGFHMGHIADEPWHMVDALFVPNRNEFRGQVSVQLQLKQLKCAQGGVPVPTEKARWESLVRETAHLSRVQPPPAGETEVIRSSRLTALLQEHQGRGILLLGHSAGRLQWAMSLAQLDVTCGRVPDPRCFSTLLMLPQPEQLQDCWHIIVLLDGDVIPGEAALIRSRCPNAMLLALKPEEALTIPLMQCRELGREHIGRLYLALKRGVIPSPEALCEASGLSLPQLLLAAHCLQWAGLAEHRADPMHSSGDMSLRLLPPDKKTGNPQDCPTLTYLQANDP